MTTTSAALRRLREQHQGIPLGSIPWPARQIERRARLLAIDFAGQDGADEPSYEIVLAPGCHGEPIPPTVGWVWSPEAAEALASRRTQMPDGSSHCRLAVSQRV